MNIPVIEHNDHQNQKEQVALFQEERRERCASSRRRDDVSVASPLSPKMDGGGFRLSSLRKSAIVAGLRGRHKLLRAVGDVSALRATDLQVFVSLLLID